MAILIIVLLVALVALGVWAARRSSPPPVPDDLRRADEAEARPTASEEAAAPEDTVSEAFGETTPPH
jgi:hypothetical protein